MKIALVTTTINVPEVLRLYRRCGPDVSFFVAGDQKTPDKAVDFCSSIGARYLAFSQQEREYPQLSALVGPNCVPRRNFAVLEAIKSGADIIVSIDDDNVPLSADYFSRYSDLLGHSIMVPPTQRATWPFNGIKVTGGPWFDPGMLQFPTDGVPVCQRGFPQSRMSASVFEPVVDARVGVAQGMILGDPDTSAVDRISRHPTVHQVSELLRAGIVSDPREIVAPLNSQNIAFTRELAPCFLMVPQFGRYDDIWASLIAQRIMAERGLHVHYGQPLVLQQRNQHDLVKDLEAEMLGMKYTLQFSQWLDQVKLSANGSVIEHVQMIYDRIEELPWMPKGVSKLGIAWAQDCAKVMG